MEMRAHSGSDCYFFLLLLLPSAAGEAWCGACCGYLLLLLLLLSAGCDCLCRFRVQLESCWRARDVTNGS